MSSEQSKIKALRSLQSILEDPLKMKYLTKEMFRLVDKDGSNFIDVNEFHSHMNQYAKVLNCIAPDIEDVKEIVSTFDNDGDYKISVEEFEVFVREIVEKMIDSEIKTLNSRSQFNFK
jgi:calmodulin